MASLPKTLVPGAYLDICNFSYGRVMDSRIFRLSLVSGNLRHIQPNLWRDIRQCVTPVNAQACPTPIRTEL
jgi:hypothetical protein